jgi:hypothetical protein
MKQIAATKARSSGAMRGAPSYVLVILLDAVTLSSSNSKLPAIDSLPIQLAVLDG